MILAAVLSKTEQDTFGLKEGNFQNAAGILHIIMNVHFLATVRGLLFFSLDSWGGGGNLPRASFSAVFWMQPLYLENAGKVEDMPATHFSFSSFWQLKYTYELNVFHH